MPTRLVVLKVMLWVVGTPIMALGTYALVAQLVMMQQGYGESPLLLLPAVLAVCLGLAMWVTAMLFASRRRGAWTAAFAFSVLLTLLVPLTPLGIYGLLTLLSQTARNFFNVRWGSR